MNPGIQDQACFWLISHIIHIQLSSGQAENLIIDLYVYESS